MRRISRLILVAVLPLLLTNCLTVPQNPEEITVGSWSHFKQNFILSGRVFRPKEPTDDNSTVSEGQAYSMIRAVLMNDRKTFDACLAWTETFLSRKASHGDKLLEWHFPNRHLPDRDDTMSASDADIDYAYSLILAHRAWNDQRYLVLAKEVLTSVLEKETALINGKIYLLPWPKKGNEPEPLVRLNPSYYAPSHFKLFYEVTGDNRWNEMADTTYDLLGRLIELPLNPQEFPDWVDIDQQGVIKAQSGNGWDAVRVPLRIAVDYYLYGDKRALEILRWFAASYEKKYDDSYNIDLTKSKTPENALFYSAAYAATEAAGSSASPAILQQIRKCIQKSEMGMFFNERNNYYINSLSWLPEYYHLIKRAGKLNAGPLTPDNSQNRDDKTKLP
jgi:endo-1,4-beta-D-glucanase Y